MAAQKVVSVTNNLTSSRVIDAVRIRWEEPLVGRTPALEEKPVGSAGGGGQGGECGETPQLCGVLAPAQNAGTHTEEPFIQLLSPTYSSVLSWHGMKWSWRDLWKGQVIDGEEKGLCRLWRAFMSSMGCSQLQGTELSPCLGSVSVSLIILCISSFLSVLLLIWAPLCQQNA